MLSVNNIRNLIEK
jgi:hypothetical protein